MNQELGHLFTWAELESEFRHADLLVGNGMSRSVSKSFEYPSLLAASQDPELVCNPLESTVVELFNHFGTTNFEAVLLAIRTGIVVGRSLGDSPIHAERYYREVKDALVEAVRSTHTKWSETRNNVLTEIGELIYRHLNVYTTNYDLLAYWSMLYTDEKRHADYFWNERGRFIRSDVDIRAGATAIHYLHGALHLYYSPFDGTTFKKLRAYKDLLQDFGNFPNEGDFIPLVITEGDPRDKLEAIARSEYLSFVHSKFARRSRPLVIFGQGLTEHDQHIIEAMQGWPRIKLAISMRRTNLGALKSKQHKIKAQFPDEDEIYFFDAQTHPLGAPGLNVDELVEEES